MDKTVRLLAEIPCSASVRVGDIQMMLREILAVQGLCETVERKGTDPDPDTPIHGTVYFNLAQVKQMSALRVVKRGE